MYRSRLQETLPDVCRRIEAAAARVGRTPDEVKIIAVTKGHPLEAVESVLAAGLWDLGENRLEELTEKAARVMPTAVRWHMIGHVQRRKAAGIFEIANLFHALDSVRLAERLQRISPKGSAPLPVLVQVNTSGEGSKGGLTPATFMEGLEQIVGLDALRVEGLMTMAPHTQDEGVLRTSFRRLRECHEAALQRGIGYRGRELSMGMSNDFEWAVEEGSTMVRLGTVLLGERLT